MKLMPVKTAQWLFITTLSAALAYGAAQQVQLPAGEGKTIYDASCSNCHGAEVLKDKQASKNDWKSTIDRMVSYGSVIEAKQIEVLSDYLAANFGNKPKEEASKEDPAKKIVEASCGGCHGLDLVTGRQGTKAEWQEIVDRMIGRGASIPAADIAPVVDYLAKTYAPK